MTKKIVAAVEGGGTTFRLVVGEMDDEDVSSTTALPKIIARTTVDSSQNPQTALQECVQFLQQHRPAQGYYDGLGLATFGPVGVHPHRPEEYGCILPTTPKPIWRSVNLLQPLLHACSSDNGQQVPKVLVDTDVNAPALSEFLHYNETVARNNSNINAEKITSLAYVTVGTGTFGFFETKNVSGSFPTPNVAVFSWFASLPSLFFFSFLTPHSSSCLFHFILSR